MSWRLSYCNASCVVLQPAYFFSCPHDLSSPGAPFFFLFRLFGGFPLASVPVPLLPHFSSVTDGLLPVDILMDILRMHICGHPCLRAFFMLLNSWSWYLHLLSFLHPPDFQWHDYIFETVKYLAVTTQIPGHCILVTETVMVEAEKNDRI